jgi:hypothetical protein
VHALPNVQTQSLAIQASAAANLLNNCIQVLYAKPSSSPNVKNPNPAILQAPANLLDIRMFKLLLLQIS